MIKVTSIGSFKDTEKFLHYLQSDKPYSNFPAYGREGVDRLASATPIETGETAHSWGSQVGTSGGTHSISWFNTHTHNGVHIATILQYGHGTGTGGYVPGRDYINPAMQPLFDKIVNEVWRGVTSA